MYAYLHTHTYIQTHTPYTHTTQQTGAALGGYATSLLGTTACFWLDALTYLTAAAFASQLHIPAPGGVATVGGSGERVDVSMTDDGCVWMMVWCVDGVWMVLACVGCFCCVLLFFICCCCFCALTKAFTKVLTRLLNTQHTYIHTQYTHRSSTTPVRNIVRKPSKPTLSPDDKATITPNTTTTITLTNTILTNSTTSSVWSAATHAWRDGVHAIREGWEYMKAPVNRDVACLGTIKATGAMCWGITDLLNVKYVSGCVRMCICV